MREVPVVGVRHPAADLVSDGYLVTESRAPVIFLTGARVSLLAAATEAGVVPILVTDELSRLTPAFVEVWRGAGGGWVVRGGDGTLREGFTGRRLGAIGELLTVPPVASVDDVAVGFLRPYLADSIEVAVTVSLRHRPNITTVLGGPLLGLAELVGTTESLAWDLQEPVGRRWSRDALTGLARTRMPEDSLFVVAAPDLRATVVARRTEEGVEELTEAHLSFGAPTTIDFEATRRRLLDFLGRLASTSMPLVGLMWGRPGRRDLLNPPFLQHQPTPLALLVGPPAVRAFGIDVKSLVARFDAQIVGRPRIPGLLFSLGRFGEPTWERLDDVLGALPQDRIDELLGLTEWRAAQGPDAGGDRRG